MSSISSNWATVTNCVNNCNINIGWKPWIDLPIKLLDQWDRALCRGLSSCANCVRKHFRQAPQPLHQCLIQLRDINQNQTWEFSANTTVNNHAAPSTATWEKLDTSYSSKSILDGCYAGQNIHISIILKLVGKKYTHNMLLLYARNRQWSLTVKAKDPSGNLASELALVQLIS